MKHKKSISDVENFNAGEKGTERKLKEKNNNNNIMLIVIKDEYTYT